MSSPGVGRLVGLRDSDDHDDIIDEGAAESVKELRRAAVWGDKNAQFSLGLCYHEGCGVTKNHVEAAWWFRRAAKQVLVSAFETAGALGCMW
jgi:TPR repeat protein